MNLSNLCCWYSSNEGGGPSQMLANSRLNQLVIWAPDSAENPMMASAVNKHFMLKD